MLPISLLPCNFIRRNHRTAFLRLLRSYMTDPMGGVTPHSRECELEVVEALWNHPTAYIQFAILDDKIVGMAVCFLNYSTFCAAPFVNVHDLTVLPAYRGLGVAKALLHGVTLYAMQRGCAKVTLEVREENIVARALYARMGFQSSTPSMEYLTLDLVSQRSLSPQTDQSSVDGD